MMPKKIAYMGWLGHKNVGDEACFYAVKQQLPNNTQFTCWDINPWKERYLPDVSIVGGGTLLNLGGDKRVSALANLAAKGVPTVFWGTGILPWNGRVSPTVRTLLESASAVGVRGPRSLSKLSRFGFSGGKVIGDPAFLLQTPATPLGCKSRKIAINIGDARGNMWGTEKRLVAQTNKIIQHAVRSGLEVVLFPMWPSDMKFINTVAKGEAVSVRPWSKSTVGLMNFMKSCRAVVGMKLHAIVLSAAAQVPFISMSYREKNIDFAKSLGLGGWSIKTDDPHLADKVGRLLASVETHAAKIRSKMVTARAQYAKEHKKFSNIVTAL